MTLHTNLFKQEGLDISVENVVKTYRTGEETHQALQGVTCDVNRGAVMIIQGPSGCGKTTFLNLLGGIDRSDSGKIQVGNWQLNGNITERDLARYRLEEVGFIFQAFNLIPGLNALDNLQLPMTVSGMKHRDRVERAHALLKLVDLDKKALKRPDELSGGEQQRVAAALALVNDPMLILADEPTGNLDSKNAMILTDLLVSLAHGFKKTVLIATHDPAVGARGDIVLQFRDGTIDHTEVHRQH